MTGVERQQFSGAPAKLADERRKGPVDRRRSGWVAIGRESMSGIALTSADVSRIFMVPLRVLDPIAERMEHDA